MKIILGLVLVLFLVQIAATARAGGRMIEGGPDPLAGTRSIGDLIEAAQGAPVHLFYVHGMRAERPGASKELREAVARHLGGTISAAATSYVELGPRPDAWVGLRQVWASPEEWAASRPFVDRYEIKGPRGTMVVHEINWWPLLFPLKCRFLLLPEHELSGSDRDHLKLCARSDGVYHPWITAGELRNALTTRPRSGGGVLGNSVLKRQILNWGLSDAVIAVGPMRHYIRQAMNGAFARAEEEAAGHEHVVVAESLGSFVVLDAYGDGEGAGERAGEGEGAGAGAGKAQGRAGQKGAVAAVLDQTHNLYFFANQFALLELGRIRIVPPPPGGSGEQGISAARDGGQAAEQAPAPVSPLDALKSWGAGPAARVPAAAEPPAPAAAAARPRQVIALSDPSDMLTYRVPALSAGVRVVNLYVRNTAGFLGLVADPVKAHRGHLKNPRVWDLLLKPTD